MVFNQVLLMSLLTVSILSEELNLISTNAPAMIECQNASTTCIINCIGYQSCNGTEIGCHPLSSQACIINLRGNQSAQHAIIKTYQSPLTFINATGVESAWDVTIYGHQRMGSKLYIYGYTEKNSVKNDFYRAIIYAPVGEGSLLSIKCNCRQTEIYNDWTTQIYQQPMGHFAFHGNVVNNIFDTINNANVVRTDNNYIGLNTAYRAPVFLNNCDGQPRPWRGMNWNGHNHGHWTIYSQGYDAFFGSVINATASIAPYGNITEYDIKLIAAGDNVIDTNIYDLTIYADQINQNGPNIYAEVTKWWGLTNTKIYAKHANSVNIYCHNGGDCNYIMVECPENNLNNSCKIYCDDTINANFYNEFEQNNVAPNEPLSSGKETTECYDMNIYSTNGYCKDAAIICIGNNCVFSTNATNGAKVYCGYDQQIDYTQLISNETLTNFGTGNCNNGYNIESECDDVIIEEPVSLLTTFSTQCDEFPTDIFILIDSLQSDAATTAQPTTSPTTLPTISPTTMQPDTSLPTISPTTLEPTSTSAVTIEPSSTPITSPIITSTPYTTTVSSITEKNTLSTDFTTTIGTNKTVKNEDELLIYLLIIAGSTVILCICVTILVRHIIVSKRKKRRNAIRTELVNITGTNKTDDMNTRESKTNSIIRVISVSTPNEDNPQDMEQSDDSKESLYDDTEAMYGGPYETANDGQTANGHQPNISVETKHYLNWNTDDLMKWILSLQNGYYTKYKQDLQIALREHNVSGNTLPYIEKDDWMKTFGIKDFMDSHNLVQHVDDLINGDKEGGDDVTMKQDNMTQGNV